MPPPPADPLATRIFLGPALRTQPDRRLVKLVREGYEAAFEEIVRRYCKPLDRFAAAIVGGRSEDVTQDAFSKALLALRGTATEIELRPWLYRIVRNTALNDLREAIPGGISAAAVAEGREEIAELMGRLRALPEPQRAAIVMRELEGLSHEEIAAALGVSGGAARQAIYRARIALRDGLGMLVPLPFLRLLFDHAAEAAGAGAGGAAAAAGAASAAGGGAGTTLGGVGAAGALKVGVATALIAGSVGAGVAMEHDRGDRGGGEKPTAAATVQPPGSSEDASGSSGSSGRAAQARLLGSSRSRGEGGGEGRGHDGRDRGPRHGEGDSSHGGRGPRSDGHSGHRGRGPSRSGHSGSGEDVVGDSRSGEGAWGGSQSGRHGGDDGGGDSESRGSSGSDDQSSGSGSSGSSGSGDGGGGDDLGASAAAAIPPPTEPPPPDDGDGSRPGSGDDGSSSSSGSGGGEIGS